MFNWIITVLNLVAPFLKAHPEIFTLLQQLITAILHKQGMMAKGDCCEDECKNVACLRAQRENLVSALEHNCHIEQSLKCDDKGS